MKKIFITFLLLTFLFPMSVFSSVGKKKAIYFYSETCERCQNVENFFVSNGLDEKYEIKKLDTHQKENFFELNSLYEAFGVAEEKRGVPVIFFDREFLAGDSLIFINFEKAIGEVPADFFPSAEKIKELSEAEKAEIRKNRKYVAEISSGMFLGGVFSDIINPFYITILVLLIWLIILARTKKKSFIFGLFFSLAIFISHFFWAIFAYWFPGNYLWQNYLLVIISILLLAFANFNLKGIFLIRRGRFFEKKKIYNFLVWWREFENKNSKLISDTKSFFLVGIISSLIFWAYPNEPYRALVEFLKEENNWGKTVLIILCYNLVFISPLLIFSGILERFSITKKLDIFGERIGNLIKILLGVIMLFVGLYLALILINN